MKIILISAYACNPQGSLQLHPGEDLTGWMFIKQISRYHRTIIITHSYNKSGILEGLKKEKIPNASFRYLDLPLWLRILYKIEFAQRIYYYIWQFKAWRLAKWIHKDVHFDLAQHLTFGNDWIPSFIGAFLPVPFIWGPVGGGQRTPKELKPEYTIYGRFAENIRSLVQWFGRHDYVRNRCLKRASAILVCNKETLDKVPEKYSQKASLFPVNGIAVEDLGSKPKTRKNSDKFRIISAGRLHRLKGFSLAIRAFAMFEKKYPDSELTIFGEGPEGSRLLYLIRSLKLESKVFLLPWQPRKIVLEKMRSSHIFLFLSFRDGGGAVVVEAMASSLPVVCLNSGGPSYHIDKEWGIKINPNPKNKVILDTVEALEKIYQNELLRVSMGESARNRAEEYYLWDRMGERLMQIYEQVSP